MFYKSVKAGFLLGVEQGSGFVIARWGQYHGLASRGRGSSSTAPLPAPPPLMRPSDTATPALLASVSL